MSVCQDMGRGKIGRLFTFTVFSLQGQSGTKEPQNGTHSKGWFWAIQILSQLKINKKKEKTRVCVCSFSGESCFVL